MAHSALIANQNTSVMFPPPCISPSPSAPPNFDLRSNMYGPCLIRPSWFINTKSCFFFSRLGGTDLLHSYRVCAVAKLGYLSVYASRDQPQLLNQMCTKWNTLVGFIHDKRMNRPNRPTLLLKQARWVLAQTSLSPFTLRSGQSGLPPHWTLYVCLCYGRAGVF